jgi:hypothetical protein
LFQAITGGGEQGVSEGLTEMGKSQPSAGRDTGPREGPEGIAKPITKEKMVKRALDALAKSMAKKDDKKKDVKEELTMKTQQQTYKPSSTSHSSGIPQDRWPDTSNSLPRPGSQGKEFMGGRDISTAKVPNVTKNAAGFPTVQGRFHGKAAQTRIDPSITPTTVARKDGRIQGQTFVPTAGTPKLNTSWMNKDHQDFYNRNPNFARSDYDVVSVGKTIDKRGNEIGGLASKFSNPNKPAQVVRKDSGAPVPDFLKKGAADNFVRANLPGPGNAGYPGKQVTQLPKTGVGRTPASIPSITAPTGSALDAISNVR